MMWGDAEWTRRDAERQEREREHRARLADEAAAIEQFLALAHTDRDAAEVVAMAKLIAPDGWASRANTLDSLSRRPLSNDPVRVMQAQLAREGAALTLRYGLNKAREAIALVRSWS